MKRVICLYRVSTKSQVDYVNTARGSEEDIPVQRNACHKFCEEKKWTIVKEFQETAVSAYFTPTFGREAIREILVAAQDHEFDVLLVFTLDRLSRRDYEFPMLIEQMTENGITVWSVKDGECSYRTPTDRLLVYLAGWKATCESERLGERVKAAQSQMVARGEYRGGPIPFGYRLVKTDQLNRSGRHKQEMQIHDDEAEVVRMIFRMIVHEGTSLYSLSQYLQTCSFPETVRKQEWRKTTLQSMLRNPIYIGCLKFNNEVSLPFERLQILDPALFQKAQALVRKKSPKRKSDRQYPNVKHAPLYHSLLFCRHCNAPLVFTHAFQLDANRIMSIRYYYRCYGKERFVNPCNGACSYSAIILDAKIRAFMDMLATIILQGDEYALMANAIEYERAKQIADLEEVRSKYQELQENVAVTQKNISVSLQLYGIAATTPLELFYRDLCEKLSVLQEELDRLEKRSHNPEKQIRATWEELRQIKRLCAKYLSLPVQEAEQMFSKFIKKIHVGKGYQLHFDLIPDISHFVSIIDENSDITMLLPDNKDLLRIAASAD